MPNIIDDVKKLNFNYELDPNTEVFNLLDQAVFENPPVTVKEGSLIKSGYNKELDELRSIRSGGKEFIASFEETLKEETGIKNLKVGSIVKMGSPICEEGVDGATANHLHLVCGNALRGCGNGFIQNSNGKWVSKGYCLKPEEVMFIDKEFTNILSTNDLTFKDKPKEERTISFLGSKGYLTLGDSGDNVNKIALFMKKNFPAYTSKKALGSYYGKYIKASITEFQKRTGLLADGNIGPITLAKLKEYGFQE